MGKIKQQRLAKEAAEKEAKASAAAAAADKKAAADACPNKQASPNHKPQGYTGYPSIARPQ